MNNLVNTLYFKAYQKVTSVNLNEERGAEAVEWVAMVAIIITLLLAVSTGFASGGEGIGTAIVNSVVSWGTKIITGG